jgi:hypothetical protein
MLITGKFKGLWKFQLCCQTQQNDRVDSNLADGGSPFGNLAETALTAQYVSLQVQTRDL